MFNPNPFQQSMIKMVIPAGMSPSISISGFNLEADSDGCVEVPKNLLGELQAHGLVPFTPPPELAKAGRK